MKAYSQDVLQRVLRAVDVEQSQAETAKTFAVSVATIKRYLKQRRETDHGLPKRFQAVLPRMEQAHHLLSQDFTFPKDRSRVGGKIRSYATITV